MATKEEKELKNRKELEKINIEKYEGYTEGPWWINHEDGDGATSIWNGCIDKGNMNHVADVDAHENDLILMAAAPEMYAALEQLVATWDSDLPDKEAFTRIHLIYIVNARKALRKAKPDKIGDA